MRDLEKFYLAIDNNDVEGLEELIQKNAALPDHIGPPPPLHWAIYQDRPEIVKVLLKYPLDVERRDSDRAATPLEYAIVYGRTEIIRLLLGHGVNTRGVIALAERATAGGFEQYAELPSRAEYESFAACALKLNS